MARVKRAVHAKKKRRVTLERAKGYYGNKSRSLPRRQRAGHALACSTPTATAGPARASSAGCGSSASTPPAARTASATAGSSPACRPPGSRSTARSWPTSPSPTPAAFAALVEAATEALDDAATPACRPGADRPGDAPSRSAPDTHSVQRLRRLSRRRSARTGRGRVRDRRARRSLAEALDAGVAVDRACVAEPGLPDGAAGRAAAAAGRGRAPWPHRRAGPGRRHRHAPAGGGRGPHRRPSPAADAVAAAGAAGARAGRRGRPRQRRHAAAHGRGRRRRRPWCSATARSTRSAPRCVRASAGLAVPRCRDRAPATASTPLGRAARAPGCRTVATVARGGDALRRRPTWPARWRWCSATRPTACPPTWPPPSTRR